MLAIVDLNGPARLCQRVEKMMKVSMLVLATAYLAAAPAAVGAQAQQQPKTAATSIPGNPSEVVCEKQEVTGSRLAHRRVCMTRSQWNDARRQDRQAVEKVQTERGLVAPTPGG
jgi:invasion protein IalB